MALTNMLIGGERGSGKSVALQPIVAWSHIAGLQPHPHHGKRVELGLVARLRRLAWGARSSALCLCRSFRSFSTSGSRKAIQFAKFHTVGSLLKDLGVPARDAQVILGYTRINTTLAICTDAGEPARLEALTRLQELLGRKDA